MKPDVARIGALEKSRERELRRNDRRHVLEAVHGDIDVAVLQRFVELLDEQTLAADSREQHVSPFVAGRFDRHDVDVESRFSQLSRRFVRLPERERTAAGADAKGRGHQRPNSFRIVRRSDSRS